MPLIITVSQNTASLSNNPISATKTDTLTFFKMTALHELKFIPSVQTVDEKRIYFYAISHVPVDAKITPADDVTLTPEEHRNPPIPHPPQHSPTAQPHRRQSVQGGREPRHGRSADELEDRPLLQRALPGDG